MTTDEKIPVYNVEPKFTPKFTMPRPRFIDSMEPFWAALSVGEFIGAPQSSPDGSWEISRFEMTDDDMLRDYMRSHGDGKGRWTGGKGTFVKLERIMPGAGEEGGPGREVVMSNTPQEMKDHTDALANAFGNVLVHGLGLSCVVSGLLAKADVKHIDVVEIDGDVIDMVGPAYAEESRVTIHQGSCLDYPWPTGKRWNYVWHDIWSNISDNNLRDDAKAEHNISYATLHRKFGQRADMQGSWGLAAAREMRGRFAAAMRKREKFNRTWRNSSYEERVDLLIDYHHQTQYHVPGIIDKRSREEQVQMMENLGLMDNVREAAQKDKPPGIYIEW